MLGYHVERSEYVYIRLYWLFQGIEKTNWQTLLLGIENLLLFYSLKYFKTRAAKFSCTKRNAACALIVKTLPVALLVRQWLQQRAMDHRDLTLTLACWCFHPLFSPSFVFPLFPPFSFARMAASDCQCVAGVFCKAA